MGYTTDFKGKFTVTPPLNEAERVYLTKFAKTRRMNTRRGPYYVGASGFMGQDIDDQVINGNEPPAGQPGLWCQWLPSEDGSFIEWGGGEKFYHYTEWLNYINDHFLKSGALARGHEGFEDFTFDHVISGQVSTTGECGATGVVSVVDGIAHYTAD